MVQRVLLVTTDLPSWDLRRTYTTHRAYPIGPAELRARSERLLTPSEREARSLIFSSGLIPPRPRFSVIISPRFSENLRPLTLKELKNIILLVELIVCFVFIYLLPNRSQHTQLYLWWLCTYFTCRSQNGPNRASGFAWVCKAIHAYTLGGLA